MLLFKLISIVAIILAGIVGGLIPLGSRFTKSDAGQLDLGNAFAGGIFLGAGFLHMLPDALDNFSAVHTGTDYPLALLLAAIGFLVILGIDKLASSVSTAQVVAEGGRFPVVLFVVLAIHSIIAGMSLGLESTLLSGVVIFVAIVAHKGSASFALGVSMVEANVARGAIRRTIAFFSFMTPLGIAVGSLLSLQSSGTTSQWFEAIFDSLAAGTFLYIATLEILADLFTERAQRWSQLGLVIIGFALMATIAIWT